jgi:hypothetical protein
MMKKLTYFLSLVFAQVSTVVGQGYREAVNRTLNPDGMEQIGVLYETVGWRVAAFVALPLLGILGYGFFLSEWKRENYWLLLILGFFVAVGVVAAFPFVFQYL